MTFFSAKTASLLCLVLMFASASAGEDIDFERDIAPIINEHCIHCHGEDEQESGLRLDLRTAMLRGGDYGNPTIVPGDPAKSYLIEVVTHADEDMAMPPDEDKIPDDQIELLTRWIKEGAVWPGQMEAVKEEKSDHWSFQPIVRPEVPPTGAASGPAQSQSSTIDAFLLARLSEDELSFAEPADPRSLVRRTSIVLTGLVPTAEETTAFLSAYAKDPETSYKDLVDRLLDSPHFGERWAQHWLDVIRWAETNGSESNAYRKNAWIYRDYVIRSFNENKPYDQFLFEQLAGDSKGVGDATGYLVAGPHVPLATVGREPAARRQARADRLDEILQTVGASAMGMTIGCARCHNHKFDPISIKDYYSMTAVFQDIEFGGRFPELAKDHPRHIRGQELHERIKEQRIKLRQTGPWEEDWTGYKEIHIPFVKAKSVRFTFPTKFVRIDELEIFGTTKWNKNLALASLGTTLDCSEEITSPGSPVTNINDGEYGNDSWIVRRPKGSKSEPWVQFSFTEPHEIFRIRISTNREDFFETDYLDGLNKMNFEPYKVEVQDEGGQWKQVAGSKQIEKLNDQHKERVEILKEIQSVVDLSNDEGPKASFVGRFIKPVKTHVFSRGSPESPRDEVFAAGLKELGGKLDLKPDAPGKQRRKAFANWLTEPANPLTARVAANRLWHHVFGQGIVTTTSDFGLAGTAPTHPELLDWLASELTNPSNSTAGTAPRPWSMKHLIRMMVMSDAFRQSSLPRVEGLTVDANSALLWRFPPKRMEAEVIRDAILIASGKLEQAVGGRSFRIHNVKKRYAQWEVTDNHGSETWRRMIYQERMRRVDDQLFTAFDFPDCGQVRAKRPISTTPLQALNLMNSDFVLEQSQLIADRAEHETDNEIECIDRCFQLILGRFPEDQERLACQKLTRENSLALVCRALINTNEFAFLP